MSDALSSTGILVKRKALTPVAATVATSSVAAASVLTTSAPHLLVTGDQVVIAGHTGSTPAVNGTYIVTVLSPTTFSIPLAVTVAGTGGTATPGFQTIAEIRNVGPGGKSRNKIETSIHNEGSESHVLGILRQKDPTLKINFVGSKASHQAIDADILGNIKNTWQIAFPSGRTRTGDAHVQQLEFDDAPVDGVEGASITLVWSGVVTEAYS